MSLCKNIVFALSIFGCCGCAHLATVKETQARLPTATGSDERLRVASKYLVAAEQEQPLISLGNDISAARLSLNVLEQRPGDSSALSIYNFSVARAVQNVERANLQPWQHPTTVSTDQGSCTLLSPKPIDTEHDPGRYEVFPTDTLKIRGKFFKTYSAASGLGAPLVLVGRSETPNFRQQYKYRRVYAPATAIVRFSHKEAKLEFIDPLRTDQVALNHQSFPLAADFDAPAALLIAREHPDRLGFSRLINPGAYSDTTMLCQLQDFDPARTPVIFVHGLQETGASWVPMIESLRRDPFIRRHYQFWFYSYPSGYPYPYSAALFRRDLDGIMRAYPHHKPAILIGHSMGGMICRLMVTDARDKIWRDFFGATPAKTLMTAETRKLLEEALVFDHRRDVQRVIFISTPHRGSKLATSWIGRIGSSLVRTPRLFGPIYDEMKLLLIPDPAAGQFSRMPNSVDTLEPNDRFVHAVNKLPITPGIPYNSIMGDRGRGDTPNSSDGVVPYWSSHLEGAESELVVNSDHGAQYNADAIREVKRILRKNLGADRG